MDRVSAINRIGQVFASYRSAQPGDSALLAALSDGKLYEVFVLGELVRNLHSRGFQLRFIGTTLAFQASPGAIHISDPHFEVIAPNASEPVRFIFLNIEFMTLGHGLGSVTDLSDRHELDIVVTTENSGYPSYAEIALAVECKAVANFKKGILKEALGIRRELSYVRRPQASLLTTAGGSPHIDVKANPPSEFWLAFCDPKGLNYCHSPLEFGVDLRHIQP
jgi:hypothetical protein